MVYKFATGYSAKVPAQVVGEELARIREDNGDSLSPSLVVESARPEDSPIHPAFEWDDEVAAEHYRDDQARRLIRYTQAVYVDPQTGESQSKLHYISVQLPEGQRYVTTARAMSDDDLKQQVEEEAMRALEAWQSRYQHIRSLTPFFAAINRVKRLKRQPRQMAEANA